MFVPKKDVQLFEKLTHCENEIIDKINTFDNESKTNQQNADNSFQIYKNKIDIVFDTASLKVPNVSLKSKLLVHQTFELSQQFQFSQRSLKNNC